MRAIALLVVSVLLPWASIPVALLHAHAQPDHEHEAHRHGPAWHSHAPVATVARVPDLSRIRLEPCNPAAHAVDVAPAATPDRHVPVASAPPACLGVIAVPPRSGPPAVNAEPRAHGPPGRAAIALRAPPASISR